MSLLELSPSKLNPTRFPLSGWQLRQAVIASLDEKHIQQDGKGAGFRGKVLGTLGFSYNVRIDIKTMTIWVDGELLQDTRIYDCVSDDYLQRGSGYPSLKTPDAQAIFYNGFIRDLLMRQLPNPKLWETCYIQRNNGSE
ncbi:hypothetical protein SDC9_164154 [bioreactor metagenome]|uniref:5'-Nucleotidase C-terminal domain-containing protein n=1 Tax=bioreactor metagenome TaxID=1076179 RepID=A0A645FQV3_9ZZZZ